MWNKFKQWFGGWGYRVARTFVAEQAKGLYDLALKVVVELSTADLSSEEKFKQACSKLWSLAVLEGLEHSTNAIRKAVEDMVAVAKHEKLGGFGDQV